MEYEKTIEKVQKFKRTDETPLELVISGHLTF